MRARLNQLKRQINAATTATKQGHIPSAFSILDIVVEPYCAGVLIQGVTAARALAPVQPTTIGVPHRFPTDYGHQEQHIEAIGLTPSGVRTRIEQLIHAK
jgi:hypothetical protein